MSAENYEVARCGTRSSSIGNRVLQMLQAISER